MATKLTIIFEETSDDLSCSGGWPDKSLKTFVSEYSSGTTWSSFILDMAEACEGVGYGGVKDSIRLLGFAVTDRDVDYRGE